MRGERVEIGCHGGRGRTGTVLACMATLAGIRAEDAVEWVRANYHRDAVEREQPQWVLWFARTQDLLWCYFRNLVHTVYREIRHVGPREDKGANLCVTDSAFVAAVRQCAANRSLLKGTKLFEMTAGLTAVDDVLKPYNKTTGLRLSDLISLFEMPGWKKNYGGPRWAQISRMAQELEAALRDSDIQEALAICERIHQLRHNTGRVVPLPSEYHGYIREKWPQLCDEPQR